MPNRRLLTIALALATSIAFAQSPSPQSFDLDEATIAELQQQMQSGRETSRSLVEKYLARIASIDRGGPALHSVLETNPDALTIADQLDAERRGRGARGPLHGIPILLKDNIATADKMMTSAGSLALAGVTPPKDAFVASRLRAAGAVILGKTNLSEWANFRSTHSSSGWSGRGGQTKNPYALDRNPSGSSSGSGAAIAANLAAAAVGTETDGSIVSPSQQQLARRHQADARPPEPQRHRADRAQPGYGRPDGADGRRRRRAARGDGRSRSRRSGDDRAARRSRGGLLEGARCERAERRAHRHRAQQTVWLQRRRRSPGRAGDRRR